MNVKGDPGGCPPGGNALVGGSDRLDHSAMVLFPDAEIEIHPEPQAQRVEVGLAAPERITVRSVAGEKFDRITRWVLKDRPVMREPGDDSAEIGEEYPSNSPGDLGVSPDFGPDDIPF